MSEPDAQQLYNLGMQSLRENNVIGHLLFIAKVDWCPSPNIEYVGVFVEDTRHLLGLFRNNDTITDLDKKLELHEIGKFLHYLIYLAKYPNAFEAEPWKQLQQDKYKQFVRTKKTVDQYERIVTNSFRKLGEHPLTPQQQQTIERTVHVYHELKAILNDKPSNAYHQEAMALLQELDLKNATGNAIIETFTRKLQELQPLKTTIQTEDCDYNTFNQWLIQLRLASGDLTV